jgi:hypothetical protein
MGIGRLEGTEDVGGGVFFAGFADVFVAHSVYESTVLMLANHFVEVN